MSVSVGDITGRIVYIDKGSGAIKGFIANLTAAETVSLRVGKVLGTLGVGLSLGMVGKQMLAAVSESEAALAQLEARVKSTGAAAGYQADQLVRLADRISASTGIDDEAFQQAEATLLRFEDVRGPIFERALRDSADLAVAMGTDVTSATELLAKALQEPDEKLTTLQRTLGAFSDAEEKAIKEAAKLGDETKAQTLLLEILERRVGGAAAAFRNTLPGAIQALRTEWENLLETVGQSHSGLFRSGIEGMVSALKWLRENWHVLESAVFQTLAQISDGIAAAVDFWIATFGRFISFVARVQEFNPFANDEMVARMRQQVESAEAVSQTMRDAAEGFRIKADEALEVLPEATSQINALAAANQQLETKQSAAQRSIDQFTLALKRQSAAMDLLRAGEDIQSIEALLAAAQALEAGNLSDKTVQQLGKIIERTKQLEAEFQNAIKARDLLFDAGTNLDKLIEEQFKELTIDPQMDALLANLKAQEQLVDSVATEEERRLQAVGEALALGIEGEALQRILLANADQWNVELSETQLLFEEIYERLGFIAEDIAFDLVSNWRRAWEENESITAATVDTLRDTLLDVLQDIISQWLSQWFRAMAAWLARWIATQRIAQAASAQTAAVSGASGAGGGLGSLFGMGSAASGASGAGGISTSTMMGAGLAAFGLFVIYKGFIEDHERKFARVTISNGAIGTIESHGKKYLEGIQNAAESIVANLTQFLSDIDVEMERLGIVIIESSKSGWNVAIPGSTGKLFASMEEAISYAQVLMLKYGQFAESVSLLVRSVIASTKAISIEQLASDIAFARELETQNLEQSAAAIRSAMDLAISQWKRAEDLFLSFYDTNLPAFAEAAISILTRLSNSIWAQYNQLAGIEEDPAKAWERKKSQFRVERQMVEAQLKLWKIEIEQRIANLKAGGAYLGGLGAVTRGTLGFAAAMVQAAEVLNPALQELENILALINQTLAELPPVELPASDPNKGKGKGKGGRNRQELREDLRDEVGRLEAEALGPLHGALYDLGQNIADFRDRAKEAKLPAAEIARGVELLTEAFQRSVQRQARDYAGLENEFTRRLREVEAFFAELQSLGSASGMSAEDIAALQGQALSNLGTELSTLTNGFAGLVDPMAAINERAEQLRASVIAYAEAAGWSAEQIQSALDTINEGVSSQRQQGINSALDKLFGYLKQAGVYQSEAVEFERQKALADLNLLEAQFRFFNALDAATANMLGAAREFVNSSRFLADNIGGGVATNRMPIRVKVVDSDERDMFSDLFDSIRDAIDDWRSTIQDFVHATEELLTDEQLTGLTQEEQLDFARKRVEELVAKARTGDLEALKLLDGARREFLKELRESEGAGFGFDVGFDWIMKETAELLANAQKGENDLIAKMLEGVSVPLWRLPDLLEGLDTTFYNQTSAIITAIYDAIGSVPSFARGGIVMSGPRLVRVAEYVPEAIVPLSKLSSLIPYNINSGYGFDGRMAGRAIGGNGSASRTLDEHTNNSRDRFNHNSTMSRLAAMEQSNRKTASLLQAVQSDISAIRRKS